jgi:hypothetical protein
LTARNWREKPTGGDMTSERGPLDPRRLGAKCGDC